MKETVKKLNDARQLIKQSKVEKQGWNEFSKYKYFTPEQISQLVNDACVSVGLFHKFDLVRTELGLTARLEIFDIEGNDEDSIQFQIATEIPAIKATNVAQQLGGCVTYSERYLLQIAFDIKDNNLDFDSKNNKPSQTKNKPVLNPESDKWADAIEYLRNGNTKDEIKAKFEITEKHLEDLVFASTI
jgi:hypothetical protein